MAADQADRVDAAGTVVISARARLLAQALVLLAAEHDVPAVHAAPQDVVDTAERLSGRVVLVGADIGPEELNHLAHQAHQADPPLAVVLLEVRPGQYDRQLAATLGAAGWITTDCDGTGLIEAIAAAALGRTVGPGTETGTDAGPNQTRVTGSLGARHRRSEPAGLDALTHREREVLALLSGGYTSDGVADRLRISRHTVRTHVQNMMGKLLVGSRAELIALARRSGVTPVRASNDRL